MTEEPVENKKQVLEFLRLAFANRTAEALAHLSDDARWWVSGNPERLKVSGVKNRRQIERLLSGLAQMVPAAMQIEIHSATAEEDRVAVEVESRGVWFNGAEYHNRYHFLCRVGDSKIVEVREYMDTLHLSEVLAS